MGKVTVRSAQQASILAQVRGKQIAYFVVQAPTQLFLAPPTFQLVSPVPCSLIRQLGRHRWKSAFASQVPRGPTAIVWHAALANTNPLMAARCVLTVLPAAILSRPHQLLAPDV